MMKKVISILMAALICALPLCAMADDGFVQLATLLMSEEIMGTPSSASYMDEEDEDSAKVCTVYFALDQGILMVTGKDNDGNAVALAWRDCDSLTLVGVLYALSSSYETLSADCENGMLIAVRITEDGEWITIQTASQASLLASLLIGESPEE